jgi:hypothetical protein
MKIKLKGRRFDTVEEFKEEMQTVLSTLTMKHFQGAFQKQQKRWDRRVRSQGKYLTVLISIFRELVDCSMYIYK